MNMLQQPAHGGEGSLRKMILPPNPKDSFPSRLHQMLTDIDLLSSKDDSMKKLRECVSWLDHGMSFKIHKKKEFENLVMPVWFNRLKCNSFLRQLSLYGFVRSHKMGEEKGAWSHESFRRDSPDLALHIERMDKNKRKSKAASIDSTPCLDYLAQSLVGSPSPCNWEKLGSLQPMTKPKAQPRIVSQTSTTDLPEPSWQDKPDHEDALKCLLSASPASVSASPTGSAKGDEPGKAPRHNVNQSGNFHVTAQTPLSSGLLQELHAQVPPNNMPFWQNYDAEAIQTVLHPTKQALSSSSVGSHPCSLPVHQELPGNAKTPTNSLLLQESFVLEPTPIAEGLDGLRSSCWQPQPATTATEAASEPVAVTRIHQQQHLAESLREALLRSPQESCHDSKPQNHHQDLQEEEDHAHYLDIEPLRVFQTTIKPNEQTCHTGGDDHHSAFSFPF